MARPMPVLPDVGSMIVAPGFSFPAFSADSIMFMAMRSLTDPPGFIPSTFTKIFAGVSSTWTSGVCPIASRMLLCTAIGSSFCDFLITYYT